MELMTRDIDTDYEVILERDNTIGLQVSIRDKTLGVIEWVRNTGDDGKLAVDIFHHPFFYGFGLDR